MQDPERQEAMHGEPVAHVVDELDRARAQEYALLSTLLARSPDAVLIEGLAGLRGDASPLGLAHAALGQAAAQADLEGVQREYFDLFSGLGRDGLRPYASYYLTGSLYGRPLARLRDVLRSLGIEPIDGQSEPEDHAAILLEIMATIADGRIAVPMGTEREIFTTSIAPWIGRFFADLQQARPAKFYAAVGTLGLVFMEIETEAFALPA
jgi:TorA maturation chaperone TorD